MVRDPVSQKSEYKKYLLRDKLVGNIGNVFQVHAAFTVTLELKRETSVNVAGFVAFSKCSYLSRTLTPGTLI